MATAIDKNFSDARWQAQGPKLLEPTIGEFWGKILRSWGISEDYFLKVYQSQSNGMKMNPEILTTTHNCLRVHQKGHARCPTVILGSNSSNR